MRPRRPASRERGALSTGTVLALASALVILLTLVWWLGRQSGTNADGDPGARPSGTHSATATAPGTSQRTMGAKPDADATPASGLRTIAESDLPQIARDTLHRIRAGGPFPFEEDGQTFQNREGILPDRQRGYYEEYTVKKGTRGDRGPLRIVTGRGGDLYWTDDHYDSFRQIEAGR